MTSFVDLKAGSYLDKYNCLFFKKRNFNEGYLCYATFNSKITQCLI